VSDNKFCSWEDAVEWLISQPDYKDLVKACYYDRPLIDAAERFYQSEEWKATQELLPAPPGKALDIGAGNGIASYALATNGWETTAIEPDKSEMVGTGAIKRLAKETCLNINVVEDFGENLPFADNSFDLIYARQVLHHARDLKMFCKELYRVLKISGVLIACREHVISSLDQLSTFQERHPLHVLYGGENAYTLKEYKGALKDAGFILKKVLGPFDSSINYAPFTKISIREEIIKRLKKVPGGKGLAKFIFHDAFYYLSLHLLSLIDRRPGRLFTFLAIKSG